YAEGYEERLEKGEEQRQLSKEFVRQGLISNVFMGKAGQQVPEMTPAYCEEVSKRYIELYEHITGKKFEPVTSGGSLSDRIYNNVSECLSHMS
ncbi:MAG: phosphoribosylaminoimidazolesuccinocarboxamide synthase, partial [Muribaculaceae bacterium]|nr:phosphoribosylaminoimidazolesuccinocarboxamide synthase [Muribaculaceae bacterium]